MADVNRYVGQVRSEIEQFLNAFEALEGSIKQYAKTKTGGADYIAKHFNNAQGENRPDLDITADQFILAISSLQALQAFMEEGHAKNLYKAKP